MRWDADYADPGAPGLAGLEQSDQLKLYWQTRLLPVRVRTQTGKPTG